MMVIKGVAASPGIAIGPAHLMEDEEIVINREEIPADRVKAELKRFKTALDKTNHDLDAAEHKVLKTLGKEHARLIETHRLILSDPLITKEVARRIQTERVNAEFALSEALETVNQAFEKIQDEFFRERRHDLFDVGKRLLSHLLQREKRPLGPNKPAILIAHNLLPSDTLMLKESQVVGFATDLGGKTSHTAILAQSMELPAVVGLSDISRRARSGDLIILDGEQGLAILQPTPEVVARYRQLQEKQVLEEKALDSLKGLPAQTRDGFRVRLMANYDAPEELKAIHDLKGDGIGLFRTEFLYLNRTTPPSEEEQYKAYASAVKSVAPNVCVIRTADIGGDRVADLGIEGHQDETNPFMGLRGVRLFLRYQELFKTQLRAILRASEGQGRVAILFPMVSSLPELLSVKKLVTECANELKREGHVFPKMPELGILVEVPSAALLLDSLLEEVDFISIGTNDLIQYVLAVDRINEHVAHLYDPFHPAVLRLLHQIVESAAKQGKWASVCGEVTSDTRLTAMLLGLGLDGLSVSPRMYLRVKQQLRSLSRETCVRLVRQALQLRDSYSIQQLLTS